MGWFGRKRASDKDQVKNKPRAKSDDELDEDLDEDNVDAGADEDLDDEDLDEDLEDDEDLDDDELDDDDDLDDDDLDDEEDDDEDEADEEDDEPEEPADEWATLDASKDWRDDGPFDFDEVDLELDDEDIPRIDFGSLILTPSPDMQLQLQVDQASGEVQTALAMMGGSGLEVALFAAPTSGGLARQVRHEMLDAAREAGGNGDFAEGPFGTEVRRVIPVKTDDGQEGLHISRTWLVEGPRWLLRGVLMGEAALVDDPEHEGKDAELIEFFKNVVVRRGDTPKPPGDLVTMTLPDEMKPDQQ